MAEANNLEQNEEVITTEDGNDEEVQAPTLTLEEALSKLAELTEKSNHDAELLKKVRRYEKSNKQAAEQALLEQNKYKELYETVNERAVKLQEKIKTQAINQALDNILKEEGADAPNTVKKLINYSLIEVDDDGNIDVSSIDAQIKELKKSDPILFKREKPTAPPVKRATDGTPTNGYEQELKAAVAAGSQKQVYAVMRKYNIIH